MKALQVTMWSKRPIGHRQLCGSEEAAKQWSCGDLDDDMCKSPGTPQEVMENQTFPGSRGWWEVGHSW